MRDVQKELGITVNASSMSFDNIIKAISVMQYHLGIAGTTAAEAGQTFQGSFTMMKASWENLKIAIVDPEGNVNEAIQNLVDSTKTFAENAFPLFNNALKGIATAVKQLAPQIGAALPKLVVDLLPDLATAAIGLINGIMEGITSNIDAINDVAVFVILSLVQYLIDNIPNLLKAGVSIITGLVNGIASALPQLIPAAVRAVLQIVSSLTDNASKMADAAVALIEGLAEGIVEALPILIKEAPKIIINLVKKLIEEAPRLVQAGLDAIKSIVEGLAQGLPSLTEIWESAKKTATEIWNALKKSLSEIWESIKKSASDIWNAIKGYWTENIQQPLSQIWDGIKAKLSAIWEVIKATASLVWNSIKEAVTKPIEAVKTTLSTIWESIKTTATTAWNAVSSAITPVINGIKSVIEGVINTVRDVITWFENLMGYNGQDLSETTSGHTHTNTTINRVINEGLENLNESTGIFDAAANVMDSISGYQPGTVNTVWDAVKTAMGWNSNAKGNWAVPYDDFPALLHRNEMVLTASQARRYRDGGGDGIDYARIGTMIGASVERAMRNINVYLGADRVGALTSGYVDHDIKASDMAILRGMGG